MKNSASVFILRELFAFLMREIKIVMIKMFYIEAGVFLPFSRVSRAAETSTPTAVNCQLSSWSQWTDCFPCQDKKVRHGSAVWGHLIFGLCTGHSNGDKQPGLQFWRSGEKLGLEIGTQKPWAYG